MLFHGCLLCLTVREKKYNIIYISVTNWSNDVM